MSIADWQRIVIDSARVGAMSPNLLIKSVVAPNSCISCLLTRDRSNQVGKDLLSDTGFGISTNV